MKDLVSFFDAERAKYLGSRRCFPITSVFHIVEGRWNSDPADPVYLDDVVFRSIVLPYLLYGEVVVDGLRQFLNSNLPSIKLLTAAQEKKLCVDLDEHYPEFHSGKDEFPEDFRDLFIKTDGFKCATMAELVRRRERLKLTPNYAARVEGIEKLSGLDQKRGNHLDFNECLQAVSREFALFGECESLNDVALEFISGLSDEALAPVCGSFAMMTATFHLQALRLRMQRFGANAIPVHYEGNEQVFNEFQSSQSLKAKHTFTELIFRGIAIPNIPNRLELLDFVIQDEYRRSIAGLRNYISNVANGNLDDIEICERLRDDFDALEKLAKREKVNTIFGLVKLCLSKLPSALLEIAKMNVSGAVDKIVEVAEISLAFKDDRDKIAAERLYMLWKISQTSS